MRLRRQLSRRAGVASGRRVRLPLGIQPRVRRSAVHRRGRDQLTVRIGDEDGDGAGRLPDDEIDDRLGVRELHRPIVKPGHAQTK